MVGGGWPGHRNDDYVEAIKEVTANYECTNCETGSNPDDHKKVVLHWCNECDEITYHERRNTDG